ncbi:GGDEF domain-containing protein [Paracidovorax wautersii]|uniref:diguanylate cyclase n=1 Tax=Paracidovorax wautersii TaxID=1177982 RepID=A0A1I1ZT59_9BURK|nr:sensor domain-containing diguanylate cyclase [Paracidovorax wautersii]SFE33670.1 diguanylate cyclase (GGDEF) domain-containing protein [Paracidovorax wautersii]
MHNTMVFDFLDVIPMPVLVSEMAGNAHSAHRPRFVNTAFLEQIGYGLDEIPDIESWFRLAYPDPEIRKAVENDWFLAIDRSLAQGRRIAESSAPIQCKNGQKRWFIITAQVRSESLPNMHIVTFRDIHDLKMLSDKNHRLSQTDQLTGVFNRRAGQQLLESEMARSHRSGLPFSVVMCDVDHFKFVNDQWGHACGDQVLCRVAQTLRSTCRNIDAVVRWGGDEFLVILPATALKDSRIVADRLRQSVQSLECRWEAATVSPTLSLGCAASQPGLSLAELMKAADESLYAAKLQGRNAVGVASE